MLVLESIASIPGVRFSIRAINGTAVDPVAPKKEGQQPSSENWKIKMLYDGECPLCMREVIGNVENAKLP